MADPRVASEKGIRGWHRKKGSEGGIGKKGSEGGIGQKDPRVASEKKDPRKGLVFGRPRIGAARGHAPEIFFKKSAGGVMRRGGMDGKQEEPCVPADAPRRDDLHDDDVREPADVKVRLRAEQTFFLKKGRDLHTFLRGGKILCPACTGLLGGLTDLGEVLLERGGRGVRERADVDRLEVLPL